jgi:chemotaxis protein CheD
MTTAPVLRNEVMVAVGLGEIHLSSDANVVLACLGLGSCIGISAYDPVSRIGAMAHVVLPQGNEADCERAPAKFANSALPFLVTEMVKQGAIKRRIIFKIAGGAKIINSVPAKSILDIGDRNVEAIRVAFAENQLEIKAEDLMGRLGRSVWLYIESGITRFRTVAGPIVEL